MKFPISTLAWMMAVNGIYLVVGFLDIYFKWWPTEYVQMVWIIILSLPVWIPMQRFVCMDPIWYEFKK